MAGGNMGDLRMSLTLQSRIEDETRKIIRALNNVDASGQKAQQALEMIRSAVAGIGDRSILDSFSKLDRALRLPLNAADKDIIKISEGLSKIKASIEVMDKQKIGGVAIFANGVSASVNKAEEALRKLSPLIDELSSKGGEGLQKLGVGATDNIRQALQELQIYKTALEQIRLNGGVHPVTGKVASDITKSSAYQKAIDDAKRYSNEVSAALRASVEEEKRNEQKVESIIQQRIKAKQDAAQREAEIERQRQEQAKLSAQIAQENAKSEIKWNEQKSKAFSEALQRQMQASVEEEKRRQVSLFSNGYDTSALEKRISTLNRLKEIQEQLSFYRPKLQYAWLDYETSVKPGNANTPAIRHQEDDVQRLRNIVSDLEAEFNKLGGNDALRNADSQLKSLEQTLLRLKEASGSVDLGKMLGLQNKTTDEFWLAKEAAMAKEAHVKKQNELTAAFEKYFRVQEQVEAAEKRLAEATARTNQARREAIAASRQQAESLVRDRAKELEAQRKQLQGLFGSGKNILSVDELSQIRNAFSQITQELNTLRGAMSNLGHYSIKDLFSMSRGTSDYSPLIGSMRTVLDQKQEAINLERKHQEEIAKTAAKARNDLAAAFSGANAEAKKMASIMSDIKSLFLQGGIVFGAQQFFNSIVQTGGEIVQQHIALRSILGDVQKADELFAQTQQLALQSPFKFGELNRDVKQLAAFGVEADELYDTTKRLADIASGLGVSFERLGLAYGQVKARSWLDGKELRQFAYAGLPLLQKITDLYNQEGKNGKNNYTASDVKGMITKREVSFEDVQKVLWQMTDEGGQFYNMQFVLSETLLGRWNKLIDAWDIMLGRFADGKNVVGGVFSFAIDRVTDLILALDKLSPVALSVGTVFAGKKIYSAVSSKTGIGSLAKNYTAEMNAQLKSYAIEQQKLVVEGKITQEKALQNVQARAYLLADDVSRANAMSRLALEGKLSILQMQKAVKEGLISKELINQLAIMGAITAKQEQIILGGGRVAATWSMVGAKIKTAFAAIGGWWTLGIGAIIGLWTSISGEMDAVKQKADSLRDPNSERMKPYYDILAQDKASNDTGLKKQVEAMKDLLAKSNAYTKTIDEQISKAKSLSEQYDILRQGVDRAKNVAAGDADLIADAIGASGGWKTGNPFNDTVEENVQDMQKSMAAYQIKLASMDENTKKHLSSIADEYLSAADKTKTLEEKIRILADRGGASWQWFGIKVNKWNRNVGNGIRTLGVAANKATSDINEIVEDDIPRIIRSLQDATGRYGNDFKKLCQEQPERFRTMLEEILGSANVLVPEISKKLKELTGLTFDSDKGAIKDTPLNSIQRRVFANLGNNQKQYDLLAPYLKDGSYYESKNSVKTALQDLYNEYKSRKSGGATAQEISAAKATYDALWNAASKGLGYKFVPEDKKSNKVPKDTTKNKEEAAERKADQDELKALQARLKLIKDAYSMYKQYYDKLHNEAEAANIVATKFKGQGLSNDDITKIMSEEGLRSLMEDYVTRVRNWHPRREEEMKDNKDSAIAEGVREMNDIDYRRMTEGMSDFSSSVDKSLKEMDRRWSSYQNILKATGNPTLSASASGLSSDKNAFLGKGFEGLYSDYLRNYISGISRYVGGIDAEKLKGMSDEDIKKFVGSVFAGSDAKKIDGITTSLKKLRDTIVDTEFQDAVNAYLSMIGKAMDEASVAGRANGEYQTTKTNLDNALSTGIIDKAEHDAAMAIAKAVRDSAILKSTAGYMALSSYGNGVADEDFATAYDKALKSLREELDANVISASQYASELKKLEDIQRKRSQSGLFGDNSSKSVFMKGGLPGLLSYYNDKANARRVYLKGQGYSAEDIENDEQVSKYAKLANKINDTIDKLGDLSTCISAITGVFNGLQQATQSLSDMFDALGNESMANFFSDTSDVIGAIGGVFSPAGDIVKSAMSGDVGGIVSNAISAPIKLFTSPITAFAKLHDKKLERQIKELERANKNIENIRNSIDRNLQNTLGGVYAYKSKQKDSDSTGTFEYYDQMYSSYEQQLANLQERRDREDRKKKTDKDALADYDAQIDEVSDKLETLAKDMANSIYGIDVKSWAQELTDTLVEAWAAGENAAEAYGDKVNDIMKSVAKNMLSQMYVEQYFKPLEELIEQRMEERHGKLLPEDIAEFAQSLMDASSSATGAINQTLDELKKQGLDLTNSSSSTMSSSIKGITESTADILSSYMNAVRADVSVIRQMQGVYLPKLDVTAQAQLQQLTMISENTLRNADAAVAIQASVSDMRDMMNRAQNNTKPFYVYVK